jgi:hypothetical protein
MTNPIRFRRILIISCVLLVGVALVLAVEVIPAVKTDHFRGATPQRSVPALWFMIAVNLLASAALARTAFLEGHAGWGWRILTWAVAAVVLLFALAPADGGHACFRHGPEMLQTSVCMFFGASCDVIAGTLAVIAAFLQPGEPKAI